ncbi:MAG: S-adenosylmethionine:tRNA ribosyltransferase-isomerase [Chitinophagaceae bacterium]|nr:S-adenosylmethionine:tRNA ribosyltransferase-isomerase [Chitinophagaceae bacterium]MCW5929182.1 S-adenosylmethionine:tRNA ribosyltransferase-isomerase [Chitinophagaceae bacterium]
MHPKELSINAFFYELPEDRIAKFPLAERDGSRLLVYKKGRPLHHDTYRNIAGYVPDNTLLLFNNTRVIAARILFTKPTGGQIEIFCLEPHSSYPDVTSAMLQKNTVKWNCLVGGAGKWKHGTILEKEVTGNDTRFMLKAAIFERSENAFGITFSWDADISFSEVLSAAGLIPLPPYIKRKAEESDAERYQTIYAAWDGSVAAPTAGLHFTEDVFRSLAGKGVSTGFLTLHVGAGTFKPVKSERMSGHSMHTEHIEITLPLLEQMMSHEGDFFCVGTTSLRTVESLYWMGAKIIGHPAITPEELAISQWEVYDNVFPEITAREALNALATWMKKQQLNVLLSQTQILIAPGYTLRVAKGLITNFHQPGSTLLLLVAALTGDHWKSIYDYALNNDFRFLSYGDGCILFAD